MKLVARIGALGSFAFLVVPGVWLLTQSHGSGTDTFAHILGSFLIGLAFFAGSLLWICGEKCAGRENGK